MRRPWIRGVAGAVACAALAGCATHKDTLLPHGPLTMRDVWEAHTSASAPGYLSRALIEAREALRRPLTRTEVLTDIGQSATYTRTAQNEIERQFRRLPNPDLVMYVFPHLSGDLAVPVPGYSTVFPLHERVEYALPGERTEDY
jgi:conjugative transfer region lipoprotein (TIGR03751 family)